MEEMIITDFQKGELSGFFLYMWNYHHNKKDPYYCRETNDFSFYAEKLDGSEISWRIQNLIAFEAEDRNSGYTYFSSILKKLNIIVRG